MKQNGDTPEPSHGTGKFPAGKEPSKAALRKAGINVPWVNPTLGSWKAPDDPKLHGEKSDTWKATEEIKARLSHRPKTPQPDNFEEVQRAISKRPLLPAICHLHYEPAPLEKSCASNRKEKEPQSCAPSCMPFASYEAQLDFELAYESLTDRLQVYKDNREDLLTMPSLVGDFFREFAPIYRAHDSNKDAWSMLRRLRESQADTVKEGITLGPLTLKSMLQACIRQAPLLLTEEQKEEQERRPKVIYPSAFSGEYAVVAVDGRPAVNPDGIKAWVDAKGISVETYDGRDGYKQKFLEARTAKASLQPKNGAWYLVKSMRPKNEVLNICPLKDEKGQPTIGNVSQRRRIQRAFNFCTTQGEVAFRKANKAFKEHVELQGKLAPTAEEIAAVNIALNVSDKCMQEWMRWRVKRHALLTAGAKGNVEGGGWGTTYPGRAREKAVLIFVGNTADVNSVKYGAEYEKVAVN
jgi:hypothetical protein